AFRPASSRGAAASAPGSTPSRPASTATTERKVLCRNGSRSVGRRGCHRSDEVRFAPGGIATTVGGDVDVVVVIGGLVAQVRGPASGGGAQVDLLPPDHVVDAPALGVGQGQSGDLIAQGDAFGAVVVGDHHVDRQAARV